MGKHSAPGHREGTVSVAIVGLGVRGLGVLERLIGHAASAGRKVTFDLHLVDPAPAGPRQYDTGQPDYLLLNHACAYVSMFPAARSVVHAPATTGPSLFEWARDRGLRVAADGFTVGAAGRPVEPTDNLPRRVFGEYLAWFLQHLRDTAPGNVRLIGHPAGAVDLQQEDGSAILRLDDGDQIEADYVFVTVGQRPQRPRNDRDAAGGRLIATPYPLPGQFAAVRPDETVAIAGLGLTATDAILALTVGRGGTFDRTVSPQRYVPSGREPRIVVFSRSGLPYRARPEPSSSVSYEHVVFTREAVDRLRSVTPRLDFDRDLLPLLLLELRVAYRRATLLQGAGAADAEAFLLQARAAAADGTLRDRAGLPGPGEFDAEAVYHGRVTPAAGSAAPADGEAYQRSVESWLAADLANAARGFDGSPVKAATETCREVRDTIRYAVEFGGLTDASLERFYGYHFETINRLVIGPELERSANILALLRSGVVTMPLGAGPVVVWDESRHAWSLSSTALPVPATANADWLYRGYTNRFTSMENDPAIVGSMARRGIVRPFRPDSSVIFSAEVDRSGHPLSATGEPAHRIWLFGLLCEGATFYNGYLTSPSRFERAQFDADRAVHELIERLRYDRPAVTAYDEGALR